jgi:hypothetical protein
MCTSWRTRIEISQERSYLDDHTKMHTQCTVSAQAGDTKARVVGEVGAATATRLGADEGVAEREDKEDERVVGRGEDTAVSLEQEETCSTKWKARGMGKNANIQGLDMKVSGGAGGAGLVVPVVVNLVDNVSV